MICLFGQDLIFWLVTTVLICKYHTNCCSPILNSKTIGSVVCDLLVIENKFNFGNEHPWKVRLVKICFIVERFLKYVL